MRKRQWDDVFRQILVIGMWGFVYHCISCTLYNIISEKTLLMDLKLLLLYVPLCIFAAARNKCRNFFVFLLIHAVTGGIFLLVFQDVEQTIVMAVCTFIMIAASFLEGIKPDYAREESPAASCVILFLIVYAIAYAFDRRAVMQISYYEAFIYLILFVIHKNMSNTARFLKLNEGMKHMPAGEIKGISRMLLAVFVVFLIAGMILLQNMPIGQLLAALGTMVKNIMRSVLLLIIRLLSGEGEAVEEMQSVGPETMLSAEAGEAPVFLQVLEQILMSALYIGMAAAVIYLTARVFYAFYKRFYAQQKNHGDESEFLWQNPLVKEHAQSVRAKREHWQGGSLDKKMRYMYKKYIRKKAGKKSVIPAACTPQELEIYISTDKTVENMEKENAAGRTVQDAACRRIMLYEKARYSTHECTRQDIDEMKKNLKVNS